MKRKIMKTVLVMICLGIFSYSCCRVYKMLSEYESGKNTYQALEEYISVPMIPENSDRTPKESQFEEKQKVVYPQVDFAALMDQNQDVIGWIYLENTPINYPVVQSGDNAYYLKHLFDGSYNSAGCIFLDSRNKSDFTDRNSIIYGHHMKNGTMFSDLTEYKSQAFYEEHPEVLLVTPNQNYVIKLFAGYVANIKDDAWRVSFDNEEDFDAWLRKAIEKSTFESNINPVGTDIIVSLSTCSYEFENARYVLLGILKEG